MEGTRLLCRSLTLAPETSSVQEQHGQRLRRKQDQLWGAQHRAWLAIEQGYPWQRYQYSIFTRERTTSGGKKKKKKESGIWFGRQWDVVASPEPPCSLKRVCWCWWQRFVTAVDSLFLSFIHWVYTSIFCISHFSDPRRSIAHSNTININSKQSHSCLLKARSSFMLF